LVVKTGFLSRQCLTDRGGGGFSFVRPKLAQCSGLAGEGGLLDDRRNPVLQRERRSYMQGGGNE
jgi:hypothetical protein